MFKRLYPLFHPLEYQLTLAPDRKNLSLSGEVKITGVLSKPSKKIELHSKHLVVTKATINGNDATVAYGEFDVLSLTTEDELEGTAEITLSFTGKIKSGSMHGVYESTFMHEGKKKQIIATQFESHHARECFPCIDEPEAKAVFRLTLKTPAAEPVLSNMPASKQTKQNGLLISQFEPTPRMSTYLLAFAYGDMHSYSLTSKTGVDISVWASVAHPESHLRFAATEASDALDFFTEYYKTPYPLTKCDLLALPDFDAGAMENWGLITFRELALLIDPNNASIISKQFISLVITHELSHQWFGNLVTMKWWDDLWLNESFASIMEFLALDSLHPDWHMWEEYVSSDVVNTSNRDVFQAVQAVRTDVTNPDLISTLFDPAIVYAKGGRLLKMLRDYIGDESFRKGLQTYFTTFAYQNTSRDDLWLHMSKASGIDVKALMDPWLDQPGMPKITLEKSENHYKLTQQRFLLDGNDDESTWPVPLLSTCKTAPDILDAKSIEFDAQKMPFLNQYGSAHFISHYSNDQVFSSLRTMLSQSKLSAEAKIVLFNDQILLSKAGEVSMQTLLDLVVSNKAEDRASVLSLMNFVFNTARQLTSGDDTTDNNLKTVQAATYSETYQRLGWTPDTSDTPNDLHLRIMAIAAFLSAEDADAVARADTLFTQCDTHLENLPADIRAAVLTSVVRTRSNHAEVISNLLDMYESTSSSELQHDICSALTSTKLADDIDILIARGIGKDGAVRPQDFSRWIAYLAGNQHTRPALWDFVESNWDYVRILLEQSKSYDYIPIYMARGINTSEWLDRFKAFFTPKQSEPTLERNISVAINDITSRVAWRKREEQSIVEWAESNSAS